MSTFDPLTFTPPVNHYLIDCLFLARISTVDISHMRRNHVHLLCSDQSPTPAILLLPNVIHTWWSIGRKKYFIFWCRDYDYEKGLLVGAQIQICNLHLCMWKYKRPVCWKRNDHPPQKGKEKQSRRKGMYVTYFFLWANTNCYLDIRWRSGVLCEFLLK